MHVYIAILVNQTGPVPFSNQGRRTVHIKAIASPSSAKAG